MYNAKYEVLGCLRPDGGFPPESTWSLIVDNGRQL